MAPGAHLELGEQARIKLMVALGTKGFEPAVAPSGDVVGRPRNDPL